MLVTRLDNENADRNLTTYVTVLTHTPSASAHAWCQAVIKLGDGVKDLDGTGGAFLVKITVGSQTVQPSPQSVTFGTEVRSILVTVPFMVPANDAVVIQVQSPNAADTDVDVTAALYDVGTVDVVASGGSTAGLVSTVDGVTIESLYEALLAYVAGKRTVTDNGATREVIWTKRDGTTPKITLAAASETDGSTSAVGTLG